MKKILAIATLTLALTANAGTVVVGGGDVSNIITPDVATGMRVYTTFTHMADGSGMAVCLHENKDFGGECKKWTPARDVVPAGRKFVGFRTVSYGSSSRQLEIYWK